MRTSLIVPVSTSLRSHLVTLVVVALVPVLIFSVALVLLLNGKERAALERGLRDTARALGGAVDRELMSAITSLQALAASEQLDSGNLMAFHTEAARVRDSQHEWLAVRAAPNTTDIFLVAMTGYGLPEDRLRAMEAGFDAHLVKPVEPGGLLRVLASSGRTDGHS